MILLVSSIGICSIVEWGPIHPEKESSYHRNSIRSWVRFSLFSWRYFFIEHPANCKAKVCTKGMNSGASSSIKSKYLIDADNFVKWIPNNLNHRSNQELSRAYSSNKPSKGDQNWCNTVRSIENKSFFDENIVVKVGKASENSCPEWLNQNVQLHDSRIDEECVSEGRKSVCLDKSHQESKPYQHHHVCILKGCVSLINKIVECCLHANEYAIEKNDNCFQSEDEEGKIFQRYVLANHINKIK